MARAKADDAVADELGLVIDYDEVQEAVEALKAELPDLGPREAINGDQIAYEVADRDMKSLAAAAKEGRLKPEEGWKRVIFMRMGRPGKVSGVLHYWGDGGIQPLRFTPFARSEPLHPLFINSITKKRVRRPYGEPLFDFVVEPPSALVDKKGNEIAGKPGDCKGKLGWVDPISKRFVSTCLYSECPHHKRPDGIWHSIWQAQRFLSKLKTESVIRSYVTNFDPRPEVSAFAQLVIDQRQKKLREAAGLGASVNLNLTF